MAAAISREKLTTTLPLQTLLIQLLTQVATPQTEVLPRAELRLTAGTLMLTAMLTAETVGMLIQEMLSQPQLLQTTSTQMTLRSSLTAGAEAEEILKLTTMLPLQTLLPQRPTLEITQSTEVVPRVRPKQATAVMLIAMLTAETVGMLILELQTHSKKLRITSTAILFAFEGSSFRKALGPWGLAPLFKVRPLEFLRSNLGE